MKAIKPRRRLPIGAESLPDGGTHFRVWAPRRKRVEVVIESDGAQAAFDLEAEEAGYFSALVKEARDGTLYRFRLDGDEYLYPDPISRFQPEGPHGPSRVVDASRFEWTDDDWKGAGLKGQVVYELHVGTFTREGPGPRRARELDELAALGVTCIEMMPVARVLRALRLGLRRRRSVRADAPLRRARRFASLRRRGARARARRDPRRGLQPPRPRRQLPARSSADDYFTETYTDRVGRGASTSTATGQRRGARVLRRQRRATGSTSSTWTACGSTRRRASSTTRRHTCSPRSRARCARRRAGARP